MPLTTKRRLSYAELVGRDPPEFLWIYKARNLAGTLPFGNQASLSQPVPQNLKHVFYAKKNIKKKPR